MKVQVLQENLTRALSLSSRFVNTHAQLPVLGNILFSAEKTKLSILATNLEMSLSCQIGAKVEKEGKVAIPAKTIIELISNLPRGQVTLEEDKEHIKVASSTFDGVVAGMNSSDFPAVPQALEKGSAVDLPGQALSSALSKVLFAVSTDETRPILTGVLLLFEKGSLTLVASDGFRLSQKKITGKFEVDGVKVVLPKPALSELVKIAGGEDVKLQVRENANQVIFEIKGEYVLTARMIEGEFPNFERIIPKTSTITVNIDKSDFARSVKLASVFARTEANIVKIKVGEGGIEVFAEARDIGQQKSKIDAKVEGGTTEISFNYKFLEDFLNSVEGEEIEMRFTDANSPGVFKDPKEPEFLHLIMPVKVEG